MMPRKGSTFFDRLTQLDRAVGRGPLVGRVSFNQRYAQNQHESLDFVHPHGGQAKYLEAPLLENAADYVRAVADRAITAQGSEIREGMADAMEALAADSSKRAPVWFADLRNSAHPTVEDDGRTTYDRAPKARRLTDSELRLKNRWRVHPSKKRKKRGFS